jgi:type I restriction enzyme, S subunit
MPQPRYRVGFLSELIEGFDAGVSVNSEDRASGPGEHGVLKVSAVAIGRFIPSENKAILARDITRMGPSVRAGDLLVTRANTHDLVGAAALVSGDFPWLHLSDKTWRARLRSSDHETRRWLAHVLTSPAVRSELRRRASGTSGSMKNISQSAYLRIRVATPPQELRGKLADILDTIVMHESIIRTLLTAKRRFKRGLMQQLLTGQMRLPKVKMSTQRRHAAVGDLPSDWSEFRLGDLFSERVETGRTDLPLLSITADRGVVARDDLQRRDTSNGDKSRYLRIARGDIGYNTMRMWQGVSALSSLDGIVSPAYTVVVPGPYVDGPFAATLFKFPPVVNVFRRKSQGLVDDTLSLKFHHFSRIRLRIPPVDEQRAIGEVFALLDQEIDVLERLSSSVKRQKHAFLQRLISGELSLPAT